MGRSVLFVEVMRYVLCGGGLLSRGCVGDVRLCRRGSVIGGAGDVRLCREGRSVIGGAGGAVVGDGWRILSDKRADTVKPQWFDDGMLRQ